MKATPRKGFTLVELLVAAAITLVLAGLVIAIARQTLATWQRANSRLAVQNQAQLALDHLAGDLESIVWRRDERVWLLATVQPDQSGEGDADAGQGGATYFGDWNFAGVAKPGWANPGAVESSQRLAPTGGNASALRFGQAGLWLRFFAEVPDGSDSDLQNTSTVRAVSYQLVRRRVATTSGAAAVSARRYALFRAEVRPFHSTATTAVRSTFRVGFDLTAPPYGNPAAVIAGSSQTGGSGDAEPGGLRRPDRAQVLSDDVVDFGVRFYGTAPNGDRVRWFPASETSRAFAATLATNVTVPGSPHSYAGELATGFPTAAEIFVRVLTPEGAQRIESLEAGRAGTRPPEYPSDGEWWWGEAERHSEVFTRWIELRAAPL